MGQGQTQTPVFPLSIDGWQFVKKLGEGADGYVLLYQKRDSTAVFKVPKSAPGTYEEQIHELIQQTKTGQKGLVGAVDVQNKPRGYVVGEFVEGVQLVTYFLSTEVPFNEKQQIVQQVEQAMAKLHELGFAHTDMHWGNIMYDPIQKKVYLLDYGRAVPKNTTYKERRQPSHANQKVLQRLAGDPNLSVRLEDYIMLQSMSNIMQMKHPTWEAHLLTAQQLMEQAVNEGSRNPHYKKALNVEPKVAVPTSSLSTVPQQQSLLDQSILTQTVGGVIVPKFGSYKGQQ